MTNSISYELFDLVNRVTEILIIERMNSFLHMRTVNLDAFISICIYCNIYLIM